MKFLRKSFTDTYAHIHKSTYIDYMKKNALFSSVTL